MMKQDEKRYSIQRVNDTLHMKNEEICEKHTTKKKEITDAQKVKALRDGTCTISTTYRTMRNLTLQTTLEKAVDFSEIENEDSFDRKSYDKEHKKNMAKANKVKDAIMSEDESIARKLMKEFCKGY